MAHPSIGGRYTWKKFQALRSFRSFALGGEDPQAPLEIFLELSTLCNLRCVMCPPFSSLNPRRRRHGGFMDVSALEESLAPALERALLVHCFGYGEPTLHPEFQDILDLLARYEVLIDFYTNGMRMPPELAELLVERRVFKVTFSVSGSTEEDYESIYTRGSWRQLVTAIRTLAKLKEARRTDYPILAISSLGFRRHVETLDDFVEFWADAGANTVLLSHLTLHDNLPQLRGLASRLDSDTERRALARAKAVAARTGLVLETAGFEAAAAAPEPEPLIEEVPRTELSEPIPDGEAGGGAESGPRAEPNASSGRKGGTVSDSPLVELGVLPAPAAVRAEQFYCMEPFKTMFVHRQGTVKPCCSTPAEAPGLGRADLTDLLDVWRERPFRVVRQAILDDCYPMALCGNCLHHRGYPQNHQVDALSREYVLWLRRGAGVELGESGDPTVRSPEAPARTSAESQAAEYLTWLEDGAWRVDRSGLDIVRRLRDRRLRVDGGGGVGADLQNLGERDLAAVLRFLGELTDHESSPVEGFVDGVSDRGLWGWAWAPSYPDLRLPVTVWRADEQVAEAVARELRLDLLASGKGDGRYGFSIELPAALLQPGAELRVRFGSTRVELAGSPWRLPGRDGPQAAHARTPRSATANSARSRSGGSAIGR